MKKRILLLSIASVVIALIMGAGIVLNATTIEKAVKVFVGNNEVKITFKD